MMMRCCNAFKTCAARPLLSRRPHSPSRFMHISCGRSSWRTRSGSNVSSCFNGLRYFGSSSYACDKVEYISNQPARLIVPTLGQNGTLILRSKSKSISQIQIFPQWRDDTILELVHDSADEDKTLDIPMITAEPLITPESSAQKQRFGGMQLAFHRGGVKTSLGRVGSLVEVDLLNANIQEDAVSNANNFKWKVIARVPEKSNVTCQVATGDIHVNGKLEGDTHLSTAANISVGKLRGHNVTLDNANNVAHQSHENSTPVGKGTIYIKKAIEARTVQINASERVRARMINGSDVRIQVNPSGQFTKLTKLDDDDEGAMIDIGSLYISHGGGDSEAQLNVYAENFNSNVTSSSAYAGLVRVKSTHGHISVHAKVSKTVSNQSIPLVDLGGVNGSCDVLLEAHGSSDTSDCSSHKNDSIATHVHFDAFTPESISAITCRGKVGGTSITIDRKLDAELRLLSLGTSTTVLPDTVDAHMFTSDETDDIKSVLHNLINLASQHAEQETNDSISIETGAFESANSEAFTTPSFSGIQYIQGTMKNRSGEPDSRFDVQSRGKINIDGAASQALHGFHSKSNEGGTKFHNSEISLDVLPLLSVVTDGKIKLETLSWFGSIARRYGLEESERSALGRTASRKPRLEK